MGINFGKPTFHFAVFFFLVTPIISSCYSHRPLKATQSGGYAASDFEVGRNYWVTLRGISKPLKIKVNLVSNSLLTVTDRHVLKDMNPKDIESAKKVKFSFLKTYLLIGLCILPFTLPWMADYIYPWD